MHQPYVRIAENRHTAVLFLHGIVGTPDHFRDFYPLIPEHISVYSILLDGHGGTVSDFAHSSMQKWKAQVDSVLETLLSHHDQIIIAAHSMGTLFALQASLQHPEKVRQLFLLAVPLRIRLTPAAAWTSLKVVLNRMGPNDLRAQAARAACSVRQTRKLWKYLPWIPRFVELWQKCRRTRHLLPQIRTPCTVFQSARDELVAPGSVLLLQEADIPVILLQKSGHFYYDPEDKRLFLDSFAQLME